MSCSNDKTPVKVVVRRRRRCSSAESQTSTPPVFSNVESSPTKRLFKFLTPNKLPIFLPRMSCFSDKYASPKSSTRPILSSQCSGKIFEGDISPIKPLRSFPNLLNEVPSMPSAVCCTQIFTDAL